MNIRYNRQGDDLTIYFYGELDECSAKRTKDALDQLLINNLTCTKVIFNLSGLSFMDSTGIGLLIGRYKKLKNYKIPIFISGASTQTEKVLALSGIFTIMPKC